MEPLDDALLAELQRDGRASVSSIAARVGRSRSAVSARLREMLDEGTVRVIAAVDPVIVGQHVLAHVSLRVEGGASDVADALAATPDAVFVSAVAGDADVVAELRLGTLAELDQRLDGIRALPGVVAVSTAVYTEVLKGFFMPAASASADRAPLDATDLELIELLQRDGRASYQELGRRLSLSASAIGVRLRRLREDGVIRVSAVEARGLAHRRLALGVGISCSGAADAVVGTLRESPDVDFAARTIGRCDALATIVAATPTGLLAALERLRARPGVAATQSWLHLAVRKEDYARSLRPASGRW